MSNFKVVLRADQTDKTELTPHWTPGCPVMVEAIQVSRNTETAEAFLQLKLKNVSDKVVDAFDCSVEVSHGDGVTEEVSVSCLDADIPAGKDMSPKAVRLKQNTPERLTVTMLEVKQGNSLWDPTQAPPEPASIALSLSEKALKEREQRERVLIKEGELKKPASSLKDAVVDAGDFWICSCGQPNVGRSRCCSCNVSKELLLAWEDEGVLERAADERAKQAAKEEERRARMKATILKRAKIGAAIAIPCLIIISLIIAFVINPAMQQAEQAAFMEGISPYIGHSTDSSYLHNPEAARETIYGKDCTFQLGEDGSCTLKVPSSSSWNGPFISYRGTWEGSWDPKTRELHLDGFPGGESWIIEGVKSYSFGLGDYLSIEAADSGSDSKFRLDLNTHELHIGD